MTSTQSPVLWMESTITDTLDLDGNVHTYVIVVLKYYTVHVNVNLSPCIE
jgi:hypothetical protein